MSLHLIEQDITTMEVDAIVNSTNSQLRGFSGVDKLIHQLGGLELDAECQSLSGTCFLGDSIHSSAPNLPCKYLIHTICPLWKGGHHGEAAILSSCYRSALAKADELGCRSVAFPLISAGNMEFPIASALATAVTAISEYLELYSDMEVYLTIYGAAATRIAESMYGDLDTFINETLGADEESDLVAYLNKTMQMDTDRSIYATLGGGLDQDSASILFQADSCCMEEGHQLADSMEEPPLFVASMEVPHQFASSLEQVLAHEGESFVNMMYRFMDEKGISNPAQIYKKAGVSKATYSKLIGGGTKNPSLETAVGLAMALELNYEETVEFLASAGLALSNNSKFDLIVKYFIQHGNYDIWELDVQLVKYGFKPLLGC